MFQIFPVFPRRIRWQERWPRVHNDAKKKVQQTENELKNAVEKT
jgi:hypothetical protein